MALASRVVVRRALGAVGTRGRRMLSISSFPYEKEDPDFVVSSLVSSFDATLEPLTLLGRGACGGWGESGAVVLVGSPAPALFDSNAMLPVLPRHFTAVSARVVLCVCPFCSLAKCSAQSGAAVWRRLCVLGLAFHPFALLRFFRGWVPSTVTTPPRPVCP